MSGIWRARLVAVVAETAAGGTKIGSGYLLDARRVLTAWHCTVDDETGQPAARLKVVSAKDGAAVEVMVRESAPGLDVALVTVTGDPPWDTELPGGPVVFGRLERDRSGQIDCEAAGFPRWQVSGTGDFRDVAEVHGPVSLLESAESRRAVLRDPVLTGVTADGGSTWAGFSGAAVFCDEQLIGVVIEHHAKQGQASLQFRPIGVIADGSDDAARQLAKAIGVDRPGMLRPVTAGSGIVDHAQGTRIGDHNIQDNRFTQAVVAGRDAQVAGGNITVNNYVFQGTLLAVARSAYLEQVRRIAPPDPPGLLGREAEVAELARFCLDPDGPAYAWWQAGPWAGKSALLSSFVLDPPGEVAAGGVRLVSFFITARLAAQDTREAFTAVVLEQLADLLGGSLPAVLPEVTREAYLLDLLSQAAYRCEEEGGRLVLVVDGLDEDRGLTEGPGAHSIAGLLPAVPPAGMRVVVAGRPDPPVPDDVPGRHPLRDPRIIRRLEGSEYAQDVERLARAELKRLLHGADAERDLLGMVTAARGGLSARDLVELTGLKLWEVENILQALAGRTFRSRPSHYDTRTRPDLYLLGHEELQATATEYLQLDGYHDRLHAWADGYRARGWPPETPEYLLSGYFRLLEDLGDLPRMTGCALDSARCDLMFDMTGGDAAALAEARAVLDRIAAQDEPDLAAALTLAIHRDRLADRNAALPVALPSVWAALGQLPRAEALARSITDPDAQANALGGVATVLAEAGQYEQALAVARSITGPSWQAQTLAKLAGALAESGQYEQATDIAGRALAVAHSITHPPLKAEAVAKVARELAEAGQYKQALAVARSITDPHSKEEALVRVAGVLAEAGEHEQALAVARSITHPLMQADALAVVPEALAKAGQYEQALAAARSPDSPLQEEALVRVAGVLAEAGEHEQALAVARSISITRSFSHEFVLAGVAGVLAEAGEYEEALATVRSITDSQAQGKALGMVAGLLVKAGEYEQALAVARSIAGPHSRGEALARVAAVLADAGEYEQALAVARSITHPDSQADALAKVAGVLAETGQHEQAADIAEQALAAARSGTYSSPAELTLARVAAVLADAGEYERALATARSIADPHWQEEVLVRVAEVLAEAGRYEQAVDIAGQALAVARSITILDWQAQALARVAAVLADAGEYERALATARSIADPHSQAQALARVAGVLADAGEYEQALAVARSIANPSTQADALVRMAAVLAGAGRYEQILAAARSIADPHWQGKVLVRVAEVLAEAGRYEQAVDIAGQALAVARSITNLDWQAETLVGVAGALVKVGEHEQAVDIAGQALAVTRSNIYSFMHERVPARVAGVLAEAGEYERGLAVARSITHPDSQADALAKVAGVLAETGQHKQAADIAEQAVAAARSVSIADSRAMARIARVLAEAGEYERGLAVARFITDSQAQGKALGMVAGLLVKAGEYERGLAVARSITHPDSRGEALGMVAGLLVKAGEYEQALAVARSIANPSRQADALAKVADALAEAGKVRFAAQVAAAVCAVGTWPVAAASVFRVVPS